MRTAPTDIEPLYNTRWLTRLRWMASSAIIYGSFIASSILALPLDPLPLYLVGGAVAMYNSLFWILLKLGEAGPRENAERAVRVVANVQIAADLVALVLLAHFTGGAESPLVFYFVLHAVIAGVVLPPREAIIQATLACLLYGGLIGAELAGGLPHVHFLGAAPPDLARDRRFVAITLSVFITALYAASYLASSVSSLLRRRHRETLDLRAEIGRRDAELSAARQEVAELEGIESRLLGDISREIKPSLISLHDCLASLLDGTQGDVSPSQRVSLARAERRTEEMLSMASDLLHLSQVRGAGKADQPSAADLEAIVRAVAISFGPAATRRGIVLSVDGSLEGATVPCDAGSLERLIFHLVSNAVSYSLVGGRVSIRMERQCDAARIAIADAGIGIDTADLPRVFDEFYRAENARRYRVEGAGLGLSIARRVTESSGGWIEVESQLGTGTTVTVLLPCAQERPPGAVHDSDVEVARAAGQGTARAHLPGGCRSGG